MSAVAYATRAKHHWKEWLPAKVRELKASGEFETAVQTAGKLAQAKVLELMGQGYKQHEAEEVALAEYVLLRPEPDAAPEWEKAELAKLEREYRASMR